MGAGIFRRLEKNKDMATGMGIHYMKTELKKDVPWDVVVVGGGPAGMMAAARAAERGYSVLLLEKNTFLGKKLLLTGGGRCNLTNATGTQREMLAKYKGSDQFLFSAFSQFGVKKTIGFFNARGMATKEEAEGRVFPVSDKAQSVLDVLIRYMQEGGVDIQTDIAVAGISFNANSNYFHIQLENKKEIAARSCILATGGTSHPETGSTGDGFAWLKKMGHTVISDAAALVPVALKDAWAKDCAGLTVANCKLTAFQNGKKQETQKGKMLFTHFGISGPAVLNISKDIGELLNYGTVTLELDLFPTLDRTALKKQFQDLLIRESNKKLRNSLATLIPSALAEAALLITKIDGNTPNHSVKSKDRASLATLLKAIPLNVKGLLGPEKAIVSSGGVALKEVNFKTMESRLVPGLYLIGDVLNVDRLSGGYSLQLCWTTGFVAGSNC
jgi:hypothetical protein